MRSCWSFTEKDNEAPGALVGNSGEEVWWRARVGRFGGSFTEKDDKALIIWGGAAGAEDQEKLPGLSRTGPCPQGASLPSKRDLHHTSS